MRYFYHNITKKLFNFTDFTDLCENMSPEEDLIMYTEAGDALVKPLMKGMAEGIASMFFLERYGYTHDEANAVFHQIMRNHGF